jgi:hypothetical protein
MEDLLPLHLSISQHGYPKWFVPDDSGAGSEKEWTSSERWLRTRLFFLDLLQGSLCKSIGPIFGFLSFVDLFVKCVSTADN